MFRKKKKLPPLSERYEIITKFDDYYRGGNCTVVLIQDNWPVKNNRDDDIYATVRIGAVGMDHDDFVEALSSLKDMARERIAALVSS